MFFLHTFAFYVCTLEVYYIVVIILSGGNAKYKALKFCKTSAMYSSWHTEKKKIITNIFVCVLFMRYNPMYLITITHISQMRKIM